MIFDKPEVVFAIIVGAASAALGLRQLQKRQKDACSVHVQEPYNGIIGEHVGQGAPVFTGLRVVEIATVVAAPSCGRILADLGAEVVKVECPKGDMWRNFMKEFEGGREKDSHGSFFEAVNVGKASICLDYTKPEGLAKLKHLLSDADVLVTNVLQHSLETVGLDYDTIKLKFPHLIFAQCSAWGRTGSGRDLPGYDFGAYFNATGMSCEIHEPGRGHNIIYPVSFGDSNTGVTLITGISLALRARLATGLGMLVDSSLLRVGVWSMGPSILAAEPADEFAGPYGLGKRQFPPDYAKVLPKSPVYTQYRVRDGYVMLLELGREDQAKDRLKSIFSLSEVTIELLSRVFEPYQHEKLVHLLNEAGVAATSMVFYPNSVLDPAHHDPCPQPLPDSIASEFMKTTPSSKLQLVAKLPFSLDCSSRHSQPSEAPRLGAHSDSFEWSPRHPSSIIIPRKSTGASFGPCVESNLLKGVTVVELADVGLAIASAGCQLAMYGARVVKVEPLEGDFWRHKDPRVFSHYNRGKETITCDLTTKKGRHTVLDLLKKQCSNLKGRTVLITNMPMKDLEDMGLGRKRLRMLLPGLIYALVTPRGFDGGDGRSADLGAFWAESGLAMMFWGNVEKSLRPGGSVARLPLQLGELTAGLSVVAGVCTAVFHAERTGEGQVVHVSLRRVGVWSGQMTHAAMNYDMRTFRPIMMQEKDGYARTNYPLPTANCHVTKDGQWVVLLMIDTRRFLTKTLLAFSGPSAVLKVLWLALSSPKKDPATGRKLTAFEAAVPIFQYCNALLARQIGCRTWEETRTLLRSKGLWYITVNNAAAGAAFEQAWETGGLEWGDGKGCCKELAVERQGNPQEHRRYHMIGTPVKMSENAGVVKRSKPSVGN